MDDRRCDAGAHDRPILIFAGLQTESWVLVLAGCAGAAGLALAADGLLALIEHGLAQRRGLWTLLGVAGVVIGLGAAAAPLLLPQRPTIIIGAKNFAEQYILARVIGHRLEAAGFEVSYREGLGSAVALPALQSGHVDAYVDYSGTTWADSMHRKGSPARAEMNAAIARWIGERSGAVLVGALGFENAYALAMRGGEAKRLGVASIADLVRVAPKLSLGTDLEFPERPEWAALRRVYGLHFGASRAFSPSFMYRALSSGQVDAISADPKRALPSYDALLLVSPDHARDTRLLAALRPLVGAISVERMRTANYMVDRDADKRSPDEAARWLDRR